jgi:POT family proton-dependent oligopeptide transporter
VNHTTTPDAGELPDATVNVPAKGKHPPGLAILFLTEAAERFSFYTMKNQLTLYMVTVIGASVVAGAGKDNVDAVKAHVEAVASQTYGIWGGLTWFLPVFGGIIADRYWGTMKTVFWGGVVFFCGHLILGLTDKVPINVTGEAVFTSSHCLLFGLGLLVVACGNGLFKGNISVLVGALYDRPDRRPLRDRAFQIFYIGINLGSTIAPFTAPWILHRFGWGYSFGSAAVGIAISFGIFVAGRKLLVDRPPLKEASVEARQPLTSKQKTQLAAVGVVLVMSAMFWAIYFQDGLALTLFTERHTNLKAWGWDTQNFQAINPIGILVLSPIFVLLWKLLQSQGREPSTPAKMAMGLAVLGLAMLIMAHASGLLPSESRSGLTETPQAFKVSPWYVATAFGLFVVAELFLSPMGLSFVTQYAPPGRSGLLMGLWFASLGTGVYTTGYLNSLGLGLVPFYRLLAGLMLGCALVLFLLLRRLNRILGA